MIIGLAGTFASGKDTIADYLQKKHGYYHVSTSDIVRIVAMEKYGSIERPTLYKAANELRTERGYGVLCEMALEQYEAHKSEFPAGVLVSGFRAPAEAQVVKERGGIVLFIDSSFEIRYARMQARARDEESTVTRKDFEDRECNENGGVNPAFNISAIKDIADYVILNDNDLGKFTSQIDQILAELSTAH